MPSLVPILGFLAILVVAQSEVVRDVSGGQISGQPREMDVEFSTDSRKHNLFQGDIKMSPKQYSKIMRPSRTLDEGGRLKRQITTEYDKWPNNTVYYYFGSDINDLKKGIFKDAIAYISSRTCVKFIEDSKAKNRVKIVNSDSCSSYIGMDGGEQELEFGDDCTIFGTAVHELMHVLGIYHTHARYDRDDYLNVDYSKASTAMVANLQKQTEKNSYNAVPFEYGSALMYSQNVLGQGSIESKDEDFVRTMGNRRVSFYDMQNVNSEYRCECDQKLACKNRGYTNPSDCSKCVCPSGYAGTLCNERPSESLLLTAKSTWQSYDVSFGFSDATVNANFYTAYVWIQAPVNATIETQILSMDSFNCRNACNYNGIEIKTNCDPRIVNPMVLMGGKSTVVLKSAVICCNNDDLWKKTFSSTQNPLIMVLHQRSGKSKFGFKYRYIAQTAKQ